MIQGFIQGFVGIDQIDIFAHHAHTDYSLSLAEFAAHHILPFRQIRRRLLEAKPFEDIVIQPAVSQIARDLINRFRVHQRNHRPLFHVGEQ